jgi:hypothetical protein
LGAVDLNYIKKLEGVYSKKETVEDRIIMFLAEEIKELLRSNESLRKANKKANSFLKSAVDMTEDDEDEEDNWKKYMIWE